MAWYAIFIELAHYLSQNYGFTDVRSFYSGNLTENLTHFETGPPCGSFPPDIDPRPSRPTRRRPDILL